MPRRERVVIVGAGIMGRAAAWQLALVGASVEVLERQPDPGWLAAGGSRAASWTGSSHGATRGLRYAYEDPAYARLAMHAENWWRVAERLSGRELLRMTGGLDIGSPDATTFERTLETVSALGLEHELLDAAALRSRFPAFELPPGTQALHQPGAGLIEAADAMDAFAALASDAGARFSFDSSVRSVVVDEAITLTVDRGGSAEELVCDRLVLAAGPWTEDLLRAAEGELRPVRPDLTVLRCEPVYLESDATVDLDVLCYVHPDPPGAAGKPAAAGPAKPRFTDGVYVQPQRPAGGGGTRIKVGRHGGVRVARPADAVGDEPLEDHRRLAARLDAMPAFADARLVGRDTCFYTMTPDEGFVLDYLDPARRVVLAAGFSGHGFKFAPVVGRAIAELVLESGTDFEIAGMSLARFG